MKIEIIRHVLPASPVCEVCADSHVTRRSRYCLRGRHVVPYTFVCGEHLVTLVNALAACMESALTELQKERICIETCGSKDSYPGADGPCTCGANP